MSQDKPNPPREDALAPRDVTILRPRPGVGRKPPAAAPAAPAGQGAPIPPTVPVSQPSAPAPQVYSAPVGAPSQSVGLPPSLDEYAAIGTSPLVQAAVPLLALAGRLRGQI